MINKKTYRIIKKGSEAREKLKSGIDQVVDTVKTTLGSKGRNSIFEYRGKVPRVTNDGVSIAKEIIIKDEIEDLGAQAVIDVAVKTNDMVGDGTTTSMVLSQSIIQKAFENFDSGKSLIDTKGDAMEIKRQIDKECKEIIKKLESKAKKIKTKEDLKNVAIASMEDEKLGKTISEIVWKVGKDGFVAVDDSYQYEIETDVIAGMKVYANYAAKFMATNTERKEAVFEETKVLVTDRIVETRDQIVPIAQSIKKDGGKKFVIFAKKFSKEVLVSIFNTAKRAGFDILAVKIPSLTTEQIEDLCIYLGADFISEEQGKEIKKTNIKQLGYAKKVIVNEDEAIIISSNGRKNIIKNRVKDLKEQMKKEEDKRFKKKIERRIASINSSVGQIKVGGNTDVEKYYTKLKIEDAIHSCQAALEEGIVKGGGLALKEIADDLDDNYILKEPIQSPYNQIKENAGGTIDIKENIIDPLKVVKIALRNACSLAGTFCTTESAMAWKRYYLEEEIEKLIQKNN